MRRLFPLLHVKLYLKPRGKARERLFKAGWLGDLQHYTIISSRSFAPLCLKPTCVASLLFSSFFHFSKLKPDVEPTRGRRSSLPEQRPHVRDLKRRETIDILRPRLRPLRERVHVVQKHGLSGHRLELLEHLDAVLDRDAALGPPRRNDLDDDVAHLPPLDVFEEVLQNSGLGALCVHLDERDVPPVLEDGVGENDAAAAGCGGAYCQCSCYRFHYFHHHHFLAARNFLQPLVAPCAVTDTCRVIFDDIGLLS